MIVRFFKWDQPKNITGSIKSTKELVIVKHEWGIFPAEVILGDKIIEGEDTVGEFIRTVTQQDKEKMEENAEKEKALVKETKLHAKELNLPMKIIDAKISLDESSVVVAFVADGRVDFRDLAKKLSASFGKSVRLQQMGSRDEARLAGGYGICGREFCCRKFLKTGMKSVSTEMARCQMISHRGSERLSGQCGRLMCCLSYEAEQYAELAKELPPLGTKVMVEGKEGEVVDWQVIAKKVKIKLADGSWVISDGDKITVI